MAYSRSRSTRRNAPRSRSSYGSVRKTTRKRAPATRAGRAGQTVKIVIEHQPASAVSRSPLATTKRIMGRAKY